jgi:diguanylate cyclase (GGDEF)-like protein
MAGFLGLVLTFPRTQLGMPWFIGLLTLGDAGVLLRTMSPTAASAGWLLCALMVLVAMTSYVSSIPHFVFLSSLLMIGYGVSLHQAGLLQSNAGLVLPGLLCLMLVFLSKNRMAQAEIQRIAQTQERSRNESMCDVLTGLPNRAQFLEHVTRAVQFGQKTRGFQFAVLFVDLDGFKPINDRLGHKAGDAVLRHTAKVFQGCLRKGDVVGRYGGDEFTFLINNVNSPRDGIRVAERILAKIQAPINVGEPVKVGASIGIAVSTNLHERAEDLIRDADRAMYRAKAQGKNRYVLSDQSSDTPKDELKARWKGLMQLRW